MVHSTNRAPLFLFILPPLRRSGHGSLFHHFEQQAECCSDVLSATILLLLTTVCVYNQSLERRHRKGRIEPGSGQVVIFTASSEAVSGGVSSIQGYMGAGHPVAFRISCTMQMLLSACLPERGLKDYNAAVHPVQEN